MKKKDTRKIIEKIFEERGLKIKYVEKKGTLAIYNHKKKTK